MSWPIMLSRQLEDFRGARGGVINAGRIAAQARLKGGRIFAQIMQQPRRSRRRREIQRGAERRRPIGHAVEVMLQLLPRRLGQILRRMGVVAGLSRGAGDLVRHRKISR